MYLSYHTYSYIDYYITMHFHNKFSLDNDVILVHREIGQKLITLEDFNNLHYFHYFFSHKMPTFQKIMNIFKSLQNESGSMHLKHIIHICN